MTVAIIDDINTQLSEVIDDLFTELKEAPAYPSHEERVRTSENIIEEYFAKSGEAPPTPQLDRLSTYILKEDSFDRKGHKAPPELEYPYLSERQYNRRIEHEASESHAETYDTKGTNQAVPTRSARIRNELKTRKVK